MTIQGNGFLLSRSEDGLSRRLSQFLMVWGQLIDHDIELTPVRQSEEGEFLDCCAEENAGAPECCPIHAPRGDPFYGKEGRYAIEWPS